MFPNPQNPTILLIEDDLPTRELYQRELARLYRVLAVAANLKDNQVNAYLPVDLVIVGMDAPQEKAWRVLDAICQVPGGQAIPVIAYSSSDCRRRILAFGLADYLVQPVLPSVLLEKVAYHLGRVSTGTGSSE